MGFCLDPSTFLKCGEKVSCVAVVVVDHNGLRFVRDIFRIVLRFFLFVTFSTL